MVSTGTSLGVWSRSFKHGCKSGGDTTLPWRYARDNLLTDTHNKIRLYMRTHFIHENMQDLSSPTQKIPGVHSHWRKCTEQISNSQVITLDPDAIVNTAIKLACTLYQEMHWQLCTTCHLIRTSVLDSWHFQKGKHVRHPEKGKQIESEVLLSDFLAARFKKRPWEGSSKRTKLRSIKRGVIPPNA